MAITKNTTLEEIDKIVENFVQELAELSCSTADFKNNYGKKII